MISPLPPFFLLLFAVFLNGQQNFGDVGSFPLVKVVNAMCTASGITASIAFDRPFSGIIYSMGYGNVHECVYYNAILTENVLFSIPNDRCGTRLTHNVHEMLETIENRVYVQMDKVTQTAADKQYAFVCQQPYSPTTVMTNRIGNEIRRHPVASPKPIIPIVDNRPLNTWGAPVVPNPIFHSFEARPSPFFPFQASRNSPPDTYYSQTALTTPKQTQTSHESDNSVVDSKFEPFAKSATTRAYGNRSSWSIVNTDTPHVIDDFNPAAPSTSATTEGDSDLLRIEHEERITTTPSTAESTNESSSTFASIISPKSANSIDAADIQPEAKLFATQRFDKLSESVRLEIQRGEGPFNKPINSTITMGETITLTVQGKAATKDEKQYNMFVHSCYATDEKVSTKVHLIDSSGCAIHSQVIRPMQRLRVNDDIIYYFPLKAFRFPGPGEVFFYCSIDISPAYHFPEMCSQMPHRRVRDAPRDQWLELFRSKNVTIELPNSSHVEKIEGIPEHPPAGNSVSLVGGILGVSALLVALVSMAAYFRYRKRF